MLFRSDLQAAVGCAQLKKLDRFVGLRRKNWALLRELLEDLTDVLILPEEGPASRASWFGFLITVREGAGFSRDSLTRYLESKNIQTRNLFAGNLLRHPCFDGLRESGKGYRTVGPLQNTDAVMERTFWIGVYPGMTEGMLRQMAEEIGRFCRKRVQKGDG